MSPSRTRSVSRSVAPVPSCPVSTQSVNAQAAFVVSDSVERNGDDPALTSSNKGKEKAKSPTPTPQPDNVEKDQPPAVLPSITSNTDAREIARLKEQLATQRHLLERHQTHLTHVQQSLTCQICLDLLHKPYALAPCGHITCYGCLVRWFTATPDHPTQNQNLDPAAAAAAPPEAGQENPEQEVTHLLNGLRRNQHVYKRKTCPLCRAVVTARPVEVFGVKGMVGALVRSALVDLPAPLPIAGSSTDDIGNANPANADPWKNIFLAEHRTHGHGFMGQGDFYGLLGGLGGNAAPQEERDREEVGWWDEEDGGIYRCLDCMHEIWGGICSRCGREYPGHRDEDDDDDDEDDEDGDGDGGNLRRHRRRALRQLLLRTVNDIARDDDEDDDEDGMHEEMLMADNEEYLDRLEEIEGYRDALFGAGRGGQFRVADLPPIGEDDVMFGRRLGLTDSEGDEEREEPGNENQNGWLMDDGDEGWAPFHGPGVGGIPAAQIRGLGPGSPRIYADFTDEEDACATNDTDDDEAEDVTDEDDEDDDGFIDDSEVIDLVDEEVMATLARLRETRGEARSGLRGWGGSGAGGSRAGAEGSRASARAGGSTRTNTRAQPIVILSDEEDEEEDETPVRVPPTRRRAARRVEASEDEEEEEGEIAVEDAAAALDELDFDNDEDEEEEEEEDREVQTRRRRAARAAERRRR